jgi:glycosyltransferase involved in cell wall biosynthesis
MQCGTPVICSNSSSIPEVIGEAGLICYPSDSIAFKMHLKKTCSNDTLLEVLREKGLRQSKKFSWEIYSDRVISEFEKVTKSYKTS